MRTRHIAIVIISLTLVTGSVCYVLGYRHGADELGGILARDRLLNAMDRVEYNIAALKSSDSSAARRRVESDLYASLVSIGTSSAAAYSECTPSTRVALAESAAYISTANLPPVYADQQVFVRALVLCTKASGSIDMQPD
jgi:hypothetical protein